MTNKIELAGIFSQGYGIIPKKLMTEKIDKNIKLVLAYMLSFTGGGFECFPSIKKICDDLGISKPTIIKAIKQAEEIGYITKSELYPNNPLKHNNKYTLNFMSPEGKTILPSRSNDFTSDGKEDLPRRLNHLTSNNNSINNNSINNNNNNNLCPLDEGDQIKKLRNNLKDLFIDWYQFQTGIEFDFSDKKERRNLWLLIDTFKEDEYNPDKFVYLLKASLDDFAVKNNAFVPSVIYSGKLRIINAYKIKQSS